MREFDKIISFLDLFLGESKCGMDDNFQLQYECPCCQEMNGVNYDNNLFKYNLEINLEKGIYSCWSCRETDGTQGRIKKLITDYGNQEILDAYQKEITSLRESKLYQLNFGGEEIQLLKDIEIELPYTYRKISLTNPNHSEVGKYLTDRGITQTIIDKFKIGVTSQYEKDDKMKNRVIIPSYNGFGNLNYWVGRDFTNNKNKTKYRNSFGDKKTIIFNESNINWDANVYLVEGPFDMISAPPNTIPLLGKTLNDTFLLFTTLLKKANANVIIFLDGDAIGNIKKIYKSLNTGRLKDKIFYIPMNPEDDPSTILQNKGNLGIIEVVRQQKKFTEYELI